MERVWDKCIGQRHGKWHGTGAWDKGKEKLMGQGHGTMGQGVWYKGMGQGHGSREGQGHRVGTWDKGVGQKHGTREWYELMGQGNWTRDKGMVQG